MMLRELAEQLAAECSGAAFVTRRHVPGTSARLDFPAVIDAAVARGRPWILHVEDDVQLAPAFGRLAPEALAEAERAGVAAMSLFSRSRRDLQMLDRGERYRRQAPSSFSGLLCVFLRAGAVRGLSEWAPSWYADHPEHHHAADTLLGAWLSRQRARMLVHVPSLVQHRDAPSTLHPGAGPRQSASFRRCFGG